MLVLQRKIGESIYIGDDIKITIQDVLGERVKISIDAPREISIMREELRIAMQNNQEAKETSVDAISLLKKFFT